MTYRYHIQAIIFPLSNEIYTNYFIQINKKNCILPGYKLEIKKKSLFTFLNLYKSYQEALIASKNETTYITKNYQSSFELLDLNDVEVADKFNILPLFFAFTHEKNEDNKVSLMTLHAAKGLEYDFVFLPGWEEGLFPHQKTIDETGNKGIEEERRLAYVGITRARKIINISTSLSRRFQSNWMPSLQSRFIDELDQELVKNINHISDHMQSFGQNSIDEFNQDYDFKPKRIGQRNTNSNDYKTVINIEEENIRDINEDKFLQVGQAVKHSKVGIGTIKDIDGAKAIVKFDNHGTKKLISDFLKPL